MKYGIALAAVTAAAAPACAQQIALKPIAELRLRYEAVRQDALPTRTSNALTARGRIGLTGSSDGFSATVIGQGNLAIVDHYYDGLNGTAIRPLIPDPQNIALYIAQLQYKAKAVTLTAGRQRIALDDERFVGNIAFRNNAQTFDAVRAELAPIKGLKADLSYAWSVRTIWGYEGLGARQQAISGRNILANLSYATKLGTLTGFGYLVDQNEAAVQAYRLASQTYGVRFAGAYAFSKQVKLSYQASYARQTDYRRNPNDYRASYYLIDGMLDVKALKLGGGYEVLAADKGVALTSFQTPLGTNFKFQGWADKFLTTPANGVRDLYGSVGYGVKAIGPARNVLFQAIYHDFRSDRLGQHYGTEWDAIAQAKFGKTTASIRYAEYDANAFATDTRKVWVQLDWAL